VLRRKNQPRALIALNRRDCPVDVQAVSALLAGLRILAIGASVICGSRSDRMYTAFGRVHVHGCPQWHLCSFVDAATPWR